MCEATDGTSEVAKASINSLPAIGSKNLVITGSSESNLEMKKVVSDEVVAQAKDYAHRTLRYIFAVILGAVIASVWDLNGKIYQAVGSTSVSTKALELEITRLKDELAKEEKRNTVMTCLDNKKVVDKAGCYRGN